MNYSDKLVTDKQIHAVIDGDLYACRWAASIAAADPLYTKEDFEAKLLKRRADLEDELTAVLGTELTFAWAFTSETNFRKQLNRCYKSNRKPEANPYASQMSDAKAFLQSVTPSVKWLGVEADDIMGILGTTSNEHTLAVIVSYDKDMRQLPNVPIYQSIDLKKNGVVTEPKGFYTPSQESADEFYWKQVITGDRTDGYYGLPGVGPKGADELWDELKDMTDSQRWDRLKEEYAWYYLDEGYFARMAWSARILRSGDYTEKEGWAKVKLFKPGLEIWHAV